MKYRVTHTTAYRYGKQVSLCHNLVHLTPRTCARQTCLSSQLQMTPAPKLCVEQTDFFGNRATYFMVEEPHEHLTVRAVSETEVLPLAMPTDAVTPPWESVRAFLEHDRSPQGLEACQFVYDSHYVKASAGLAEYALPSFPAGRPMFEAARDLTRRIYQDFLYDPKATTVATPLHEVLERRRGVCQDFAHLQIGCLRSLGLSARYISGYLRTYPPPGEERLVGVDASHAWLSVYCPGLGWVDLDPTNDLIPSDGHLILAWGRDYDDVSPVKGVNLGGGRHSVAVGVDVAIVSHDAAPLADEC
jgi:transglutaminase-like putative cysteine protease